MVMPLIAFAGPAGSGKTTAAQYLVDRYGYTRVRFAAPLKGMLRSLGLSDRELDGDAKEVPCGLLCGQTPRWAQQTLGTEWGRELIGGDIWIRAWEVACSKIETPIVVDDCRFENEVHAVRSGGGFVVRINGRASSITTGKHISEQEITTPIAIENDGSLPQFYQRIDGLLRDFNWILA